MEEFAVEYKKIKLHENIFLLVPLKLVEGLYEDSEFYTKKRAPIKVCNTIENIEEGKTLVNDVWDEEDLAYYYDCDEDGKFLKDYYLSEEMDYVIFVCIKNGEIYKKKIRLEELLTKHESEIYEMLDEEASVVLSDKIVNNMLDTNNLDELKKELTSLKG